MAPSVSSTSRKAREPQLLDGQLAQRPADVVVLDLAAHRGPGRTGSSSRRPRRPAPGRAGAGRGWASGRAGRGRRPAWPGRRGCWLAPGRTASELVAGRLRAVGGRERSGVRGAALSDGEERRVEGQVLRELRLDDAVVAVDLVVRPDLGLLVGEELGVVGGVGPALVGVVPEERGLEPLQGHGGLRLTAVGVVGGAFASS